MRSFVVDGRILRGKILATGICGDFSALQMSTCHAHAVNLCLSVVDGNFFHGNNLACGVYGDYHEVQLREKLCRVPENYLCSLVVDEQILHGTKIGNRCLQRSSCVCARMLVASRGQGEGD